MKKWKFGRLELTTRTRNALWCNNVRDVSKLTSLTEKEVRKFKDLGNKSMAEIKSELARIGKHLKAEYARCPCCNRQIIRMKHKAYARDWAYRAVGYGTSCN